MSLDIRQQVSLKPYNTLAIDVCAAYFLRLDDASLLPEVATFIASHELALLVIGGGSNIILTEDFQGLVLLMDTQGIAVHTEGAGCIELSISAGVNWHQLVCYCLEQGYYGLENLALIPGCAGAAPIQNIGAYGVELRDVFVELTGWNLDSSQWQRLSLEDCQFGYRDSVFKHALKGSFIISELRLHLSADSRPDVSYSALSDYLGLQGVDKATAVEVFDAVVALRSTKLPDPAVLPNAGSFFKNPLVSVDKAESLRRKHPELVCFDTEDGRVKLAAGWLLDNAGWRGLTLDDCPNHMHRQQALVLINEGGSGADVLRFARRVQDDILDKFGVRLEIEPAVC